MKRHERNCSIFRTLCQVFDLRRPSYCQKGTELGNIPHFFSESTLFAGFDLWGRRPQVSSFEDNSVCKQELYRVCSAVLSNFFERAV